MKTTSWEQIKTIIGGMGRALRRNIADALAAANKAQETADDAQTTADTAKTTADSAQKRAGEAYTEAWSAFNEARNRMPIKNPKGEGFFRLNDQTYIVEDDGSYTREPPGNCSFVAGNLCIAPGFCAAAIGYFLVAASAFQNVQGKCNRIDRETKYAHIVGNGENYDKRSNAHTLDWEGNAWFAGDVYVRGTSQDDGEKLVTESELEEAKPVRGVDYWTEEDQAEVQREAESFLAQELAARSQLRPEFAQTVEQCEDETKLYVLPDGFIYAYMLVPGAGLYVNRLPVATNPDGTIYNNVGYKNNTRLSVSDGVFDERTETGWCTTGLIPATYGDVVRLKNCVFAKTNTAGGSHRAGVYGADENGNFVSGNTSSMGDITKADTTWQPVYDEDGDNVIQFTIPSHMKNSSFIRIVVQEFNANSIITVNEEIVEAEPVEAWANTGRAFVPADYEPWIRSVEERAENNTLAVNGLTSRVGNLENGGSAIPEYWIEHCDSGIAEVRSALVNAGRNKSAFLWWHDVHWTYNFRQSPAVLKYLHNNTVINKTFFGGDVLDAENGLDLDALAYVHDWRRAIRDLPNHYSVVGNHDDGNSTETDGNIPEGFIYSMLMAAEEKPHVVYGDGYYYYFDEPAEKTRYIFCDTATKNGNIANEGTDGSQTLFVKNALLTTPEGWHIICVAHIWQDVDYTVTPAVPNGFSSGGTKLLQMFDAYNNKMGDYAECGGKVEFCIGGHTHVDGNFYYPSGYLNAPPIPVILTETDSQHIRSGSAAIGGTTTENSVNAIVADYENKQIHIIRFGRGLSRTAELY